MRYIDVKWTHDHPDEPIRLVSEIGANNYECRKIEYFRDGEIGFASSEKSTERTFLGTCEIPCLEDINSNTEFDGVAIDKQEFERLWRESSASAM